MRPDVRAFARASPHETAKAQMPRKTRSARPLLPVSASIVESRNPSHSRRKTHSAAKRPTGMTTPVAALPAALSASDTLHNATASPARPFHHRTTNLFPQIHPKPKNFRDHLSLPHLLTPRFPRRLKLFFAITDPLDLHAFNTYTQPPLHALSTALEPCSFVPASLPFSALSNPHLIINHPFLSLPPP